MYTGAEGRKREKERRDTEREGRKHSTDEKPPVERPRKAQRGKKRGNGKEKRVRGAGKESVCVREKERENKEGRKEGRQKKGKEIKTTSW